MPFFPRRVRHNIPDPVFERVSDDPGNTLEPRELLGGALGIAPCDQNLCPRLLAVYSTDGGASVLVSCRCNRTGIKDNDLSILGCRDPVHAHISKLALNGGAIGLRGTAPEVLDVVTSHGVIIASATSVRLAHN